MNVMHECFRQCQPATELGGCLPAAVVLFVKDLYNKYDRDICTYIKYANILDMKDCERLVITSLTNLYLLIMFSY